MAEPTYAEQRQKAAQLLIDQKYAGNATDAKALASAGGRPAFTRAMNDFQKSYNADPANKDKPLQDPRDMGKLVGALEATTARKAQPQPQAPAAAPVTPQAAAQAPKIDPDIQKAQGYMRALGITEVEVDGKKQEVKVDGINSPVTSAALAKYRADNGFDNSDNFSTVLGHMEGRIKQNPPGVQEFMSQTMADGQLAGNFNIMAMQLLLNLLAPIIQTLTGGKLNPEQLKIDGINGPRTTNAYNGYDIATNNNALKPLEPAKPSAPASASPPFNADPLGGFAAEKVKESDARMAATPAQPPQPEIHVRPGGATEGIEARPGVIPTVIVGGAAEPVVPGSRPALQVDGGLEAGAGGSSRAYMRSPRAYAGDNGLYQQRPTGYGDVRQQYNVASGAEVRDRMLQQRAELRAIGYAPSDVKAIVRDERIRELEGSGMNRRAASNLANIETRMVDNVERGSTGAGRDYGRVLQHEDRDITRVSNMLGRSLGALSDKNPRNDSSAYGNLAGAGIEAVLRGGVPGLGAGGARGGYGMDSTPGILPGGSHGGYSNRDYSRMVRQEDSDISRISGVFGRAVGVLSDKNPRNDSSAYGNLAGAGIEAALRGGVPGLGVGGARGGFGMGGGSNPLGALMSAITGGNSRTYTAQPLARGAYEGYNRGGAQDWGNNQIRPEFDGARSYGNAADPRLALSAMREQQIMAADQPQSIQERQITQQRLQDMYSPG